MSDTPQIAVVVLAAGASRRFGDADKLQAKIKGVPMLAKSLAAYDRLTAAYKIAVLAPDSALGDICNAAGFDTVTNPRAGEGMGTSLAAGINALPDGVTHAFIGFGDMPFLQPQTLQLIARAIDKSVSIIVPTYQDRRGHPVLFAATHFANLKKLEGDKGGRSIIAACPNVLDFAVNDEGVCLDIDTQEALTP